MFSFGMKFNATVFATDCVTYVFQPCGRGNSVSNASCLWYLTQLASPAEAQYNPP